MAVGSWLLAIALKPRRMRDHHTCGACPELVEGSDTLVRPAAERRENTALTAGPLRQAPDAWSFRLGPGRARVPLVPIMHSPGFAALAAGVRLLTPSGFAVQPRAKNQQPRTNSQEPAAFLTSTSCHTPTLAKYGSQTHTAPAHRNYFPQTPTMPHTATHSAHTANTPLHNSHCRAADKQSAPSDPAGSLPVAANSAAEETSGRAATMSCRG